MLNNLGIVKGGDKNEVFVILFRDRQDLSVLILTSQVLSTKAVLLTHPHGHFHLQSLKAFLGTFRFIYDLS